MLICDDASVIIALVTIPSGYTDVAFDFDILALAAAHEARHPMDPEYTPPGLDLGMELDVTKDASIVTAADLSEYD